jgi:hypothetical protein
MSNPIQGVLPNTNPYTVKKISDIKREIYYNNNLIFSYNGLVDDKVVADITLLMYEAYKNGYHECSIKVLN